MRRYRERNRDYCRTYDRNYKRAKYVPAKLQEPAIRAQRNSREADNRRKRIAKKVAQAKAAETGIGERPVPIAVYPNTVGLYTFILSRDSSVESEISQLL